MADLPKPLPASEWQHDMWTADQLEAYVADKLAEERERTAPLVQRLAEIALGVRLYGAPDQRLLADRIDALVGAIRGTEAPNA
jgi:hypothetical protein